MQVGSKRISPRHTPRAAPGKPGYVLGEDWPDNPGEQFHNSRVNPCKQTRGEWIMDFTDKSITEYQIVDLGGWIKWLCLRGKFYVDPKYLDEFKSEHPDAIQVEIEIEAARA
jgi:hypothetical protein